MKIGVVVPQLPIPVQGYGGIEKEAVWLAEAMALRGHDVTIYGNVTDPLALANRFREILARVAGHEVDWHGPPSTRPGETRIDGIHGSFNWRVLTAEALVYDHFRWLAEEDVVWDWTHTKQARSFRLKRYIATTMWTDQRACWGRDVYPSEAVRAAFRDPDGKVIHLGLPAADWEVADEAERPYLLAPLRLSPIKGVDHAINLWRTLVPDGGIRLIVAGHAAAPFADTHFALRIRRLCEETGAEFVPTPTPEAMTDLMAHASGVLHPHRWIESFSLAAAESLCRGVPVLTTDQGGTQEIVRATGGGAVTSLKSLDEGKPDAAAVGFFARNWTDRRKSIARRARSLLDISLIANHYDRLLGAS